VEPGQDSLMAGSTLHVHCFQLFVIAGEARERAIISMRRGPNAASSDALVAVVFAAFTAEAFINELGTILEQESIAGYPTPDRRWAAAAAAIGTSETDREKPYDKFIAAHQALSESPVDAGREPSIRPRHPRVSA
jgi:hypothetical protein